MTVRSGALIALVAVTAVLGPAEADENKRQATRAVIAGCQSVTRGETGDTQLQQGYCLGMVQAIAVANDYAPPSKRFCPSSPSLVVKDYVAAIAANAGKVSLDIYEDPVVFVTEVLRTVYPCRS